MALCFNELPIWPLLLAASVRSWVTGTQDLGPIFMMIHNKCYSGDIRKRLINNSLSSWPVQSTSPYLGLISAGISLFRPVIAQLYFNPYRKLSRRDYLQLLCIAYGSAGGSLGDRSLWVALNYKPQHACSCGATGITKPALQVCRKLRSHCSAFSCGHGCASRPRAFRISKSRGSAAVVLKGTFTKLPCTRKCD